MARRCGCGAGNGIWGIAGRRGRARRERKGKVLRVRDIVYGGPGSREKTADARRASQFSWMTDSQRVTAWKQRGRRPGTARRRGSEVRQAVSMLHVMGGSNFGSEPLSTPSLYRLPTTLCRALRRLLGRSGQLISTTAIAALCCTAHAPLHTHLSELLSTPLHA